MTTINLKCPQCDQIDSIRKVSSIVGDGTTSSTYSSYGVGIGFSSRGVSLIDNSKTFTGSSKTGLSLLLSPPLKPSERYFNWLLLLIALPGIIGILVTFLGISAIFSNSSAAILTLFLGLLFLGMAVVLFLYYRERMKVERIRFESDIQDWKKAVSKWQKLY